MDPGHPNMMGRRGDGTINIICNWLHYMMFFLRLLAPAQKTAWLVPQVAWDNISEKGYEKVMHIFRKLTKVIHEKITKK